MKILQLAKVLTLFILATCELPPIRSYLPPNNNFLSPNNKYLPPANQQTAVPNRLPTQTLVFQVRSQTGQPKIVLKRGHSGIARVPGNRLTPSLPQALPFRSAKPLKLALLPQILGKLNPNFGGFGAGRKPTRITKLKFNLPEKSTGYVYEKPFLPAPLVTDFPVQNSFDVNKDQQFGPIHTIPAPNLGHGSGFAGNQFQFNSFNSEPQQQYQVTEENTNDQIIRDQFSGNVRFFAPDPDPSLPVRKIPPSQDPFSMPSHRGTFPSDLQSNYFDQTQKLSRPPSTSYGVPLNPIPVPNLVDGMPLSVFNPSFLVSQSKTLYDQHKQQQLLKPEGSASTPASSYGTQDQTQHVTSDGQIIHGSQSSIIPVTPTPQTDLLLHPLALAPHIGSHPVIVRQPQQSSAVTVSYEAHTAQPQVPVGLNFGSAASQGGFVVSNYFGAQGSELPVHDQAHQQQFVNLQPTALPFVSTAQPQQVPSLLNGHAHQQEPIAPNHSPYYVDVSQYQNQNEQVLNLANQQLQQQFTQHGQQYSTNQNLQQDLSAYGQHHSLLGQQFSQQQFGIQIPENSYLQPSNLHKRSQEKNRSKAKAENEAIPIHFEDNSKEQSVGSDK